MHVGLIAGCGVVQGPVAIVIAHRLPLAPSAIRIPHRPRHRRRVDFGRSNRPTELRDVHLVVGAVFEF